MVQVFRTENPQGKISEMLGMSLGQGIGNGLNTYFANRSLESVLQDKALEDAPISKKMQALQSALSPYGEKGQEVFNQRMQIEQQERQEQEQDVLGRLASGKEITEKDRAKLSPANQFKAMELQQKRQQGKSVYDSLKKAGYPDETAKLWQNQLENATSVGGITDIFHNVNDLLRRSPTGKGIAGEGEEKPKLAPPIKIPGIQQQEYDLDFPELKTSIGRTPGDVVKEETENKKVNGPLYSNLLDSLNALEEDYRDFSQLQEYNRTPGALPTGAEKWNVDWKTGDLRIPALATPESQDYVKIISRLLGRAKEYFPGRVTNFDLAQFEKRFPRLANSPEGRELITKQLMLSNRIAFLNDETQKSAIDHYGPEADPTQIRRAANENYRRLKPELEKQLKELNRQSEEAYNSSLNESPDVLNVYDSSGKLVGTVSKEEVEQLPQGYSAR